MRTRPVWRGALPLMLALGGALGCDREPDASTAVGTLEMVEVDVGPLQPARAARILVEEGAAVRAGDTLATFTLPTLGAAEAQAVARQQAAAQTAREIDRGARPAEIARAEAEVAVADADAERAAADLARLEPLAAKGDVSRAALDAARAAARSSTARRTALRESLRLLREGARQERRAAADAEARAAAAAADVVRATVNDLVLLAPVDGVVTSRNAEPGEVLAAGQSAITIGQPARPWARVYVSQFVLASLEVGDTLVARLDHDSTTYRGRVSAIASRAEYTPRVALTDEEREDLLFGVRLEFTDTSGKLKAGLPITVTLPSAASAARKR